MIKISTMWKIIGFILLLIIFITTLIVSFFHPESIEQLKTPSVLNKIYGLMMLSTLITLICLLFNIISDLINQDEKNLL